MEIDNIGFKTLLVQFSALNFIHIRDLNLKNGGTGVFCKLTALGEKVMIEFKSIKKQFRGSKYLQCLVLQGEICKTLS